MHSTTLVIALQAGTNSAGDSKEIKEKWKRGHVCAGGGGGVVLNTVLASQISIV
jgi:hypothetical protein